MSADQSPTRDATSRARLEARARALAVRADDGTVDGARNGGVEFMVFRRGSERFALPLTDVVEISRHSRVTPLAGAAAPVVGLAGWRGRVLTVVDLNPEGGTDSDHLVVAGSGRAAFAIVADELEDARFLCADVNASASPRNAAYADGVTSDAITLVGYKQLQNSLA